MVASVTMSSTRKPAARHGDRLYRVAVLAVLIGLLAGPAVFGDAKVIHAFIDPQGLPLLYQQRDDGVHVMPVPQFRLFDRSGRPLWRFSGMPRSFKRELERHMVDPRMSIEGLTFRQEAKHFLRRGGLPLNLTTLPETEFTIVEYWSGKG